MRTVKVLVIGWFVGALFVIVLSTATRAQPVATTVPLAITTLPTTTTSGLLLPVVGVAREQLRDSFEQSRGGNTRLHGAIDIMAPRGTPVIAAVDGTIRRLFTSPAGGLTIYEFDGAEERVYYYAHLDRYADGIAEGMHVAAGTVIGYVGSTGNARIDAPHLHFAIELLPPTKEWWKGTPVNPYPLLAR